MHNYIFEYLNENNFMTKEKALRKYNMLAYKKLIFDYYPKIRKGNFLGDIVDSDAIKIDYELIIPSDYMFKKVHGEIRLHYSVYKEKSIILLTNITPESILEEGHNSELNTYKGVMVSKDNPSKDIFKINLINYLKK